MQLLYAARTIFSLGLTLAALASCTNKKEAIGPTKEPCATTATVHLCRGYTVFCPTQHTSLVLADGTRLRPSGPVWGAYLPNQADGQVLRIGYKIEPSLTMRPELPGAQDATLSCLEIQPLTCSPWW